MKKNSLIFLFALCPLIPAASHLAYGIILAADLLWLFLSGLLFGELVKKIAPGDAGPFIELACLGASATVFFLIFQGLFPVLSVSLGFYVYVVAFSYILLSSIDSFSLNDRNFLPIVPFFPVLLIFSLVRELLGFGTVSLPVRTGILELRVLPGFSEYGIGFWGTAGGALILLGIFSWLAKCVRRRAASTKRNS